MVFELGLVDLNADYHVDVALVVAVRDEGVDGLERLDVDVGVQPAVDVHDQVPQQVCLDDLCREGAVCLDDIRAVEPSWPVVRFDVHEIVAVSQDFISIPRVLGRPGARARGVALLEAERVDLPRLPDLAGEFGGEGEGLLGEAALCDAEGGGEGVGVRDDEDDEDAGEVDGEGALDLARESAGEGCGGLEFFNHCFCCFGDCDCGDGWWWLLLLLDVCRREIGLFLQKEEEEAAVGDEQR